MDDKDVVEIVARAIVGNANYENLPERATYLQRKSNGTELWVDREEARDDAKAVLDALEEHGYSLVKDGSSDPDRRTA